MDVHEQSTLNQAVVASWLIPLGGNDNFATRKMTDYVAVNPFLRNTFKGNLANYPSESGGD